MREDWFEGQRSLSVDESEDVGLIEVCLGFGKGVGWSALDIK